jgi:hypothetical protein
MIELSVPRPKCVSQVHLTGRSGSTLDRHPRRVNLLCLFGARNEFILAATAQNLRKDGKADSDAHPEARIGRSKTARSRPREYD